MKELSLGKMSEVEGGSAACIVQGLGGVSVIIGVAMAAGPIGWGAALFGAAVYGASIAISGNQCED